MITSSSVLTPKNARGRPVTKLCLTLEAFRRTDEGRIRDAKAFLGHFFPMDKGNATDRVFHHIPNEVRADLLSNWGIRGKKSALRDDNDKVRTTIADALNAGDIDASVIEDGISPEILVDWVPLEDWWSFWRGPVLPVGSVRKALATARELSLFDERWFFENLALPTQKLEGTDVVCAALSKEQTVAWVQMIHQSGDASPSGLVQAIGWETILAKTAHEALLYALDALARQIGLADETKSPKAMSTPAPSKAPDEPAAKVEAPKVEPIKETPKPAPVVAAAAVVETPKPEPVVVAKKPVDTPKPDTKAKSQPPPVPSRPAPPLSKPPPPLPPTRPTPSKPPPAIIASPVVVLEPAPPAPVIAPPVVEAAAPTSKKTSKTPPESSAKVSTAPRPPPPARHMPTDLPSIIVEPDPPLGLTDVASPTSGVMAEPDPFAATIPGTVPNARALFGTPDPGPGPMRAPQPTLAGMGDIPPLFEPAASADVAAPPPQQPQAAFQAPVPAAPDPPWAPPRAEPGDMGWDLFYGVKRPMANNVAPRYNFDDDDEPTSEIALPGEERR